MSAIAEPAGYRRKTTVDRRGWVRVVELLAYGTHLETCPMAERGERAKATKGTRVLCTCGLDLAIDGAAQQPPAVLPVPPAPGCLSGCQDVGDYWNRHKTVIVHEKGCPNDGGPAGPPPSPQSSPTAGPGPTCADCGKSDETVHQCKVCEKPLCDGCAEDDERSCCPPAGREPDECDNCGTPMDGHAAATSDVCLDCWRAAKEKLAAAPPPSTGEPAGEVERCEHPCTQKPRCEEPCAFACDVDHSRVGCACAAHIAAKFEFASAPPRKTPGELAREWIAWIDGAMTNSDAIAFLERAITADRGGR